MLDSSQNEAAGIVDIQRPGEPADRAAINENDEHLRRSLGVDVVADRAIGYPSMALATVARHLRVIRRITGRRSLSNTAAAATSPQTVA